jgi:hypothetical protein
VESSVGLGEKYLHAQGRQRCKATFASHPDTTYTENPAFYEAAFLRSSDNKS